jgi:hypothetical protein
LLVGAIHELPLLIIGGVSGECVSTALDNRGE